MILYNQCNCLRVTSVLLWVIFVVANLGSQAYFSKAFDTFTCYNEGSYIGQIDNAIYFGGVYGCGVDNGTSVFAIDMNSGQLINTYAESIYELSGYTSSIIENDYLIGGTYGFVPEQGIWKVDKYGNVLDTFYYNHPDPFATTRIFSRVGDRYFTILRRSNASSFDLYELDTNLQLLNYYPDFVIADPNNSPKNLFEGPDGDLYFSICDNDFFISCAELDVYRFSPTMEHELVYQLPDGEGANIGFYDGMVLPADDSSFYYVWTKDTFRYNDTIEAYQAEPGIVSKISYTGERLWDVYIWEMNGAVTESFTTLNGDIVLLGELLNHFDYQPGDYPDNMVAGGYVARVSKHGNLLWERKILDPINCRKDGGIACISLFINGAELSNGDLVFTGFIDTIHPTLNSNYNAWVVKTDSAGCLTPDCGLLQVLDTTFYTSTREWAVGRSGAVMLSISPNPATAGLVNIGLPPATAATAVSANGRLRLVDALGRVLLAEPSVRLPYTLSTRALPPGIYTVQWQAGSREAVRTGRLVVR